MRVIGQIVARRAGSQYAYALLRQRSLTSSNGTAPLPDIELTTAAEPLAGTLADAGVLSGSETGRAVPGLRDAALLDGALLDRALLAGIAAVDALRSMAFDEVRLLGFVEAADFAGRVEEMSRSV
ncbi:HNH endonuclease, partial [Paenarthrobacter aurescens]|nr:HNH endonuclease [Paenarthrobacter aurescens]MDO6158567.1 HNH endonuclease [Paenarthrobacter aurescens]MDO6162550.1 HNH endonuclease [Paenarthrobacter aurescens]